MLSGLTSHSYQNTGSASSNWCDAGAGVSTNHTSISALEVTVSVVLPAPADVSAPRLTGHTTGTADKTGS